LAPSISAADWIIRAGMLAGAVTPACGMDPMVMSATRPAHRSARSNSCPVSRRGDGRCTGMWQGSPMASWNRRLTPMSRSVETSRYVSLAAWTHESIWAWAVRRCGGTSWGCPIVRHARCVSSKARSVRSPSITSRVVIGRTSSAPPGTIHAARVPTDSCMSDTFPPSGRADGTSMPKSAFRAASAASTAWRSITTRSPLAANPAVAIVDGQPDRLDHPNRPLVDSLHLLVGKRQPKLHRGASGSSGFTSSPPTRRGPSARPQGTRTAPEAVAQSCFSFSAFSHSGKDGKRTCT